MWKIDGKEVNVPVSSDKKKVIDFECEIKQQTILNKINIVEAMISDLINDVINVSQKIKCESCHKLFANLESLKRHIRKFHEPVIKEKKVYTCAVCQKA